MSTMTLADALAEHVAALEKNTLDCNRWQNEMQAVLLAAAPPALLQSLATAQAAYNEVRTANDAAIERLKAHDAHKPVLLGNVTQWAKARGILSDELLAYSAILEERHHAAAAVADSVFMERSAAWVVLKNEVAFENNREFDSAQSDVSSAMLDVERAKGRVGQKFNKRLMMQNAIESLKPRR